MADHLIHRLQDLIALGNIDFHGNRRAAARADLFGGVFGGISIEIQTADGEAVFGEAERVQESAPSAATSAAACRARADSA